MKLRSLNENNHAAIDMIIVVIIAAIMFSISIPVVYNVIGSVDTATIDAGIGGSNQVDAANATDSLLDNLATFYDIGPIYLIVVAAVAIVGAVMLLRRRG